MPILSIKKTTNKPITSAPSPDRGSILLRKNEAKDRADSGTTALIKSKIGASINQNELSWREKF